MSSAESFADLRGDVAALMDANVTITPADVAADTTNCRPGWTLWRVGRMWVHLPTMLATAPPEAVARYWLRIRAGLTGECSMCGRVADITARPGTAAFLILPVTVALMHAETCPALFSNDELHLFDPRAWQ